MKFVLRSNNEGANSLIVVEVMITDDGEVEKGIISLDDVVGPFQDHTRRVAILRVHYKIEDVLLSSADKKRETPARTIVIHIFDKPGESSSPSLHAGWKWIYV